MEGLGDGGSQAGGTYDEFHIADVAVLGDCGFDADGSGGAGWNLGDLWIGAGD